MSKEIVVNYEEKPCYKIVLEHDFRTLAAKVNELGVQKQQKVCIIADTNTAALYLEEVTTELEKCFDTVVSYVFPAGEAHKNVDTINEIYQKLIEEKFDRKDMLAALGGLQLQHISGELILFRFRPLFCRRLTAVLEERQV